MTSLKHETETAFSAETHPQPEPLYNESYGYAKVAAKPEPHTKAKRRWPIKTPRLRRNNSPTIRRRRLPSLFTSLRKRSWPSIRGSASRRRKGFRPVRSVLGKGRRYAHNLRNPSSLFHKLTLNYMLITGGLLITLLAAAIFIDLGFDDFGEASMILLGLSFFITIGVTLIGTVFGYFVSRNLVKRVKSLDDAAASWAEGDFTVQVADKDADEIGQLGRKLNGMVQQLGMLMDERVDLAGVEERTRIARDLHDAVKQQLFASSMQLSSARMIIHDSPKHADTMLADVENLVEQMQTELMGLIHMLRPASLRDRGLSEALASYVNTWSQQMGIAVDMTLHYLHPLPIHEEEALYRVAQEALANVARHANATRVEFHLDQKKQLTILHVRDNGHGFDMAQSSHGFGMHSMQERLAKIGGSVAVHSELAQGTSVTATLTANSLKELA